MRILPTILLLCVLITPTFAAEDESPGPSNSLVAIFVFGEASAWMGQGLLVGDGQWIVTTADVVNEPITSETKLAPKHVTVLSAWTGDIYRGEVKTIDSNRNLALIKLPSGGLPGAPLASAAKFNKTREVTLGQAFRSGEQVGNRWDATLFALTRIAKSNKPAMLGIKNWASRNTVVVKSKDVNWLFISKVDPPEAAPRSSALWREDAVVGLYNGKITIGEGPKAIIYGQCLISTEIFKAFKAANVASESLEKPPAPKIKQDKTAKQGLQLAWAVLTQTVLGKWREAEKNAQALVTLRPENANANLLLGVALAGGGKPEDAIKSLDKAIKLNAAVPGGYLTRGSAYAALKETQEAENDYRKAMEQTPEDIKPMLALADLLARDKVRRAEAIVVARKAVQIAPQNPRAHLALGLILKASETYDQAIAEIKAALKIVPQWGEAKAALAAVYEASGDLTNAEAQYREIANSEPENPDALLTLASFLADHEKKTEAKELVTKLLAMKLPKELETAVKELEKKL